jgi:16S rRNA (guanine966-N2)-methyltransferase
VAARLRVISGSAGGLFLKSPKRHELRPTQDRIRQVIFSSLAERLVGARVLDLFAGTGAVGIEALSRGAASATFVESNPEALSCIQENLVHCHLKGEVRKQDAFDFLKKAPPAPIYDLVFVDPPYQKNREPLDLQVLSSLKSHVVLNGYTIIEHYAEQPAETVPGWELVRHRTYGETGLTFYTKTGNN